MPPKSVVIEGCTNETLLLPLGKTISSQGLIHLLMSRGSGRNFLWFRDFSKSAFILPTVPFNQFFAKYFLLLLLIQFNKGIYAYGEENSNTEQLSGLLADVETLHK